MASLKAVDPAGPVVSWYQRAGVWIGIATGPGSLAVGGGLAANLSPALLLVVIPVGVLMLTAVTVAHGIVSRRRREPLVSRASYTFGAGMGAGLLNLAMALALMGWISFYLGIAGFSLATLLGLPGWLGTLLLVGSLLFLNRLGLNRWNALVWVTTISALGAAVVALILVGPEPGPAATPGFGLTQLIWGLGSVIAYSIVFAVRCSDFSWDLATDADVIKDGIAFLIPLLILLGVGVLLYQTTGDWNLADILARTPSAGLGHIFLVLSVISPILSNFHSSALTLESLVSLKRRYAVLLVGAVGFVLGAARFDQQLLGFLDLLGVILPPALVVLLVAALLPRKAPHSATLTAWLLGSLAALMFKLQGHSFHLAVGAIVSFAALHLMIRLSSRFEFSDAGS